MGQETNRRWTPCQGGAETPYLAYLLRLWLVDTEEGPVWRASLQSADGVERQAFADLGRLMAFLAARTRQEEGGER